LLKEHLKYLPLSHPDHPRTEQALEEISAVATGINEGIRDKENEDKVIQIQSHFPQNFKVHVPGRYLKRKDML
jgi:hypothetical protein